MSDNASPSKSLLFKQGFVACVPTLASYWAVGFACGAIAAATGFSFWHITFLAIFLYAGSAQFLFFALLAKGAGIMEVALSVAFINLRYLLINTYMAPYFKKSTLIEKLVGSLLMTDETFGVAAQYAKRHNNQIPYFWLLGLNLVAWLNWIFANIIGALLATALPDWLKDGLSFSLVGMFVGLLILNWQTSRTRLIEIIVIIVSALCVIFTDSLIGSNLSTIAATILAATVGLVCLQKMRRGAYGS